MDLGDFLFTNASAVFALVGALSAGILSFISAIAVKRREFNFSLTGKLLDRRISAHERVITVATEMRVMNLLGGVTPDQELIRAPQIMLSSDEFTAWFRRFTMLSLEGTSWLTTDAKRELNLVQDYLATLHSYLEGVPSESFPALGALIRQDFIDLSSSLEKAAFKFFQKDIRTLSPGNLDEWHKYEKDETMRRLEATVLAKSFPAFAGARIEQLR